MTDQAQSLVPHLVVDDAAAAMAFYEKALGATETMRAPAQDGKRIMHAEMQVNGAKLYLRDDFPEFREGKDEIFAVAPKVAGATSVALHLEVVNCDASVRRAEEAGATIVMPPWDAFWGARYAQVRDPFGHVWSFGHPLPAKADG